MSIPPIPAGYSSVTPYLIIKGAAKAIEFYKEAFGATEVMHMPGPGGLVAHAEIRIGNSIVMLADENPEWGVKGPETPGSSPVGLHIYLEDVDTTFQKALNLGATVKRPLQNQFYGDRIGQLTDPFGHSWSLATHIEDVSVEEMHRRSAELMKQAG